MPDDRPLIEKLQAMADQKPDAEGKIASPEEAEIAKAVIMRMIGVHRDKKDPRVLSRDDILGTPDRENIGNTMRYRSSSGTWYTIDLDEVDIIFEPDEERPLTPPS